MALVKCIVVGSLHIIFWMRHELWNANPTDGSKMGLRFIHKFHFYVLWVHDVSSHTTITSACTSCKGSIMLSPDLYRRKFSSFMKRSIGRHFFHPTSYQRIWCHPRFVRFWYSTGISSSTFQRGRRRFKSVDECFKFRVCTLVGNFSKVITLLWKYKPKFRTVCVRNLC